MKYYRYDLGPWTYYRGPSEQNGLSDDKPGLRPVEFSTRTGPNG